MTIIKYKINKLAVMATVLAIILIMISFTYIAFSDNPYVRIFQGILLMINFWTFTRMLTCLWGIE